MSISLYCQFQLMNQTLMLSDSEVLHGLRCCKINFNLPPRMYLKHSAYYYVSRENKWIRLSEDKAIAFSKWAEIEGETPRESGGEINLWLERWLL